MTPKSNPENGARRDWLPPYMIFLLCVTSFLVIFRIILRATGRSSSLGLDDALLVPSWILQIAFASIAIFSARAGIIDRHFSEFRVIDTHTFEATALASEIIFIVGTCCLKISVLLFFRRMVKGLLEPKWRYLIWAAIAFTIGYTLSFFVVLTMSLNCFDFMAIKALGATPQDRSQLCVAAPQICIAAGVLSIISDCYAIFLPWVITRRLCLPVRRRVAMNALFASSALIVIAACVRTANLIRVHRLDDPTWNGMNANVAAMAEWSLGLILACLPTLRSVWRLSRNRSRTGSQSQRRLLSAHDLPRWSWGVGTFATRLRPNRDVQPEIVPCSILERPKDVYQGGRGLDEEKLDAWMAVRRPVI